MKGGNPPNQPFCNPLRIFRARGQIQPDEIPVRLAAEPFAEIRCDAASLKDKILRCQTFRFPRFVFPGVSRRRQRFPATTDFVIDAD